MNRFCYKKVCFLQIIFVFICIGIESSLGESKITVWPPKEPEFFDEDNDNIRGLGGRDYPIYGTIPKTSFTCTGQLPGFYADEEADCQVFHLCNNNHKISFLCGNGTVFNQRLFTCNWWYNTTCSDSHKFYAMNAELYKVKAKSNESKPLTKTENKNNNLENNKKFTQKITRLPQPIIQTPIRSPPQEVIRQHFGQQLPIRPQMLVNTMPANDPIVRHLVFNDNKEPISEEKEPEEYDLIEENQNNYEISK